MNGNYFINKNINAEIAVEPEERHRFRYLNDGSHGILNGEKAKSTVKVTLDVINNTTEYFNDVKYEIWCDVLADDEVGAGFKLSPHFLCKKGDRKMKKKTNVKRKRKHDASQDEMELTPSSQEDNNEMDTLPPVQDEMRLLQKADNETTEKYEFCLEEHRIVMSRIDDINTNLQKKHKAYEKLCVAHLFQDLMQRQDEEANRKKAKNQKQKQGNEDVLTAHLLFMIFEKRGEEKLFVKYLISKQIISLDPIHINKLCNPHFPVIGADRGDGRKAYLLLRDVCFPYKLEIREVDHLMNTCWLREVKCHEKEPYNKAMSFIIPDFTCQNHGEDTRETIECSIKLTHGRSESNKLKIIYNNQFNILSLIDPPLSDFDNNFQNVNVNNNDNDNKAIIEQNYETDRSRMIGNESEIYYEYDASGTPCKETKTPTEEEPQPATYVELRMDSPEIVEAKENLLKVLSNLRKAFCTEMSTEKYNLAKIWQKFSDEHNGYVRKQNNGNIISTLFHDAIRFDQFYELENVLYALKLEDASHLRAIRKLIGTVRNSYGETLLHLACQENKIDFIPALLSMRPEAFLVQDTQLQTPLHVAIKKSRSPIIEEFIENKNLATDCDLWTKVLHKYDHAGKTILHRAIEKEQFTLVKFLLEFCQKQEINACEIRVLGSGQSLSHLAARSLRDDENDKMMNVLLEYFPEAKDYEDYAGYDAFDNYNGPTPMTSDEEDSDEDDADDDDDDDEDDHDYNGNSKEEKESMEIF